MRPRQLRLCAEMISVGRLPESPLHYRVVDYAGSRRHLEASDCTIVKVDTL